MKIALISDLHVNHWIKNADVKIKIQFVNELLARIRLGYKPDRIVIAGDLWNGSSRQSYDFGEDVIYVNGNHDYYYQKFPDFLKVKMDTFEDIHTSATTLWSNFWGYDDFDAGRIFQGISDYFYIEGSSSEKLTTQFDASWNMIRDLNTEVVVTHYPPALGSISEQFRGNPYNPYFVNDMEDTLRNEPGKTKLWLCGHVHHRHAYVIEGTDILVACNPLGYPGENYYTVDHYEPMILIRGEDGLWYVEEDIE